MRSAALWFALLSSAIAFAGSSSQQATGRYWIADVTIISPEHLDDLFTGNVLIENGRIVRIERGHRDGAPRGATVMSAKGNSWSPDS
jgi:imidazolonepropionase-like amidohydrolase